MPPSRKLDKTRQFFAILRKNFILQTRGRKSLLGIGGWAGLILQLLLPVAFFMVMYLPKHYIKPTHHSETLGPASVRLESRSWADPYDGPATFPAHAGRARLLLAPDTPDVRGLAQVLARGLACPREPQLRVCPVFNLPTNFHCMFMPPRAPPPPHLVSAASRVWAREDARQAGEEEAEEEGEAGEVHAPWGLAEDVYGGGDGGDAGGWLQGWWRRRRLREAAAAGRLSGGSGGGGAVKDQARDGGHPVEDVEEDEAALLSAVLEDPCADFATCVSTPACYEHVLRNQFTFSTSQESARQTARDHPEEVDALVFFPAAAAPEPRKDPAQAGGGEGQDGQEEEEEEEEAAAAAAAGGGATAAAGATSAARLGRMVVGMNHTDVPPTKLLLDLFEVVPTRGNGLALYRSYWFFTNLQLAVGRAVIGIHVAANQNTTAANPSSAPPPPTSSGPQPQPSVYGRGLLSDAAKAWRQTSAGGGAGDGQRPYASVGSVYDEAIPANVEVSYKPFPWPAVTEDLGAASAAIFFNLLLVYAFLPPTRAVVGDIVREKELRLREGMRVLGLSEPSYWLSWGLTHWLLLALSGALCAAAGTYPFANSSSGLMLMFFWLYGAALVSYSYCLSTLFSSSRVAGTATQLLYALSMLPGFLLPVVYQYGSWTWYAACLSPPSAASLFAAALVNWEKVAEGITLHTLWKPIAQANDFSAATVLYFLAFDVLLYGALTWYLDKVLPKSYGQRLPWWFIFDRRYWESRVRSRGGSRGGGVSGGGARRRAADGAARAAGTAAADDDDEAEALVSRPLLPATASGGPPGGGDGGGRDGGGGGGGGDGDGDAEAAHGASERGASGGGDVAVEVRGLVKVFRTLTGADKVAVDHLDMQIDRGRITALLGHNGAGKTTTIHILTGMLQPTAGSATVNGFDVATQMDQVRASLGICPQFDILWPDLTVYEHLELYGAIKGYSAGEIKQVAEAAADRVGLSPKLHSAAGELSGGQRRKLSVAIAFLGDPAVVFLDEPTSGMDPYSRRFTWDIIRQHRSSAAIVLTTHSMEEADLLGDRVIILARGRVAAEGTGMELKSAYGVGYNLTLVIDPRQQQQGQPQPQPQPQPPSSPSLPAPADSLSNGADDPTQRQQPSPSTISIASDGASNESTKPAAVAATAATAATALPPPSAEAAEAVLAVVRRHVPSAELLSAAGAEVVVRLPREAAGSFPGLLRELEGPVGRSQLGVASYGLSLTTLEEVFLSITAAIDEQAAASDAAAAAAAAAASAAGCSAANGTHSGGLVTGQRVPPAAAAAAAPSPPPPPPPPLPPPLRGWRLYGQQLRALLAKRALCARRDRLAVVTQLLVPLALVYLSLWVSSLQVREPSEAPLELSRAVALLNRPTVLSATPAARAAAEGCQAAAEGSCLAAFLRGHPAGDRATDSGATALFAGDPRVRPSTLEAFLLSRWYQGPVYDAIHVTNLPPPAALAAGPAAAAAPAAPALSFVLLTNQSAVSSLPAALTEALTAALSYIDAGLPRPSAAAEVQPSAAASASTNVTSTTDTTVRRNRLQHHSDAGVAAVAAAVGGFSTVSWPLPTLPTEPVVQVQRDAASLMLVLCLVLASSVLSASFVVFLVREQDNNSKHLQLVSSAPPTAYWLANYGWDLTSYALSAAGLLGLIAAYRLPQFSGPRLAASAGLLAGFGPAGLSLTYLLHFLFRDEMRALQRLNTAYFLTGYLGFVTTWICDLIELLVPRPGALHGWNSSAKALLRTASPHYCFARGMYDVQSTYNSGFPFGKRGKPFDWDVYGSPMAHMAAQTLVYGGLAVLYDTGIFTEAHARLQDAAAAALAAAGAAAARWRRGGSGGHQAAKRSRQRRAQSDVQDAFLAGDADGHDRSLQLLPPAPGRRRRSGDGGRATTRSSPSADPEYGSEREEADPLVRDDASDDDVDVAQERRAVVCGARDSCQVLLEGVKKSYSQGLFRPAVAAVRGLWVGVPAGECFGLLGVNGAGKTTTFRMLTGEVLPDAGDARVGGWSVRTQLAAARRQLGYCPQFEALPGAMTGREVAAMYARLRGVPEPFVGPLVAQLLGRLGLHAAADSPCGGYSGGMKRKLGVAVALIGDPRVCALDEPSTGMDPGARRGLWSCLQSEVMRSGRTVILTSHSMEECEALCTRLTIMAAGRLRCLGTVQHLKGRFGGGYLLEIKTLPRSTSQMALPAAPAIETPSTAPADVEAGPAGTGGLASAAGAASAGASAGAGADESPACAVPAAYVQTAARLSLWVASVVPGAALVQVDQNRFIFSIPRVAGGGGGSSASGATESGGRPSPSPSLDLAALFEAVETQRVALGVVDYCLTQTTLEQVFVAMAQSAAAHDAPPPPQQQHHHHHHQERH